MIKYAAGDVVVIPERFRAGVHTFSGGPVRRIVLEVPMIIDVAHTVDEDGNLNARTVRSDTAQPVPRRPPSWIARARRAIQLGDIWTAEPL